MEAKKQYTSFLGRGWSFPPAFSKERKGVDMSGDEEDIQESLKILLSTRIGERVMQPDYGCNMDKLVFEPLTTTMRTYIHDLIETAILYHEPRIKLDKVLLEESGDEEGLVLVQVEYTVKATNTRSNMVYPFYVNEGTAARL